MKYILLATILYSISGCTKEEITLYKAYLKNTTSHNIQVKPYFGGNVSTNKIITLLANETKEIANGFDRGIVGNTGFNSENLSGSDSLIIVFDNLYSITHYLNNPASMAQNTTYSRPIEIFITRTIIPTVFKIYLRPKEKALISIVS